MSKWRKGLHALVLDIDGTLVDRSGAMSASVREALMLLQPSTKVLLASARPPSGVESFLATLKQQWPFVALNGALGIAEGKTLFSTKALATRTISQLLRVLTIMQGQYEAVFTYDARDWYAYGSTPFIAKEEEIIKSKAIIRQSLSGITHNPLYKLTVVTGNGSGRATERLVREFTNLSVAVYTSKPNYIEICRRSVSKGVGVRLMLKELGWTSYIAVGDGWNDISVFSGAEESYAMSGSDSDVIAAATHLLASQGDLSLESLLRLYSG